MSADHVLLVHPTGRKGGGMMQLAEYLRGGLAGEGLGFERIDVRGDVALAATPWTFLRARRALRMRLESGRTRLVHLFAGDRLSLLRKCAAARVAFDAGVPVLMHLHAYDFARTVDRWPGPVRRYVRDAFERADAVVVLGPRSEREVLERFDLAPQRMHVVANGVVAPDDPWPLRSADPSRFLFCGDLSERKGVSTLLEAFAAVRRDLPRATLTLVGGGDLARYRRLAGALGLAGCTEFPGWQDRQAVRRLLLDSRAMVLPSHREGLSLAVLEAMGHGTPCITTAVGDLPHYVDDAHAVRWVEPGDAEGLAQAMRALGHDDALAAGQAHAARRLFDARFTLARFAAAMRAVYAGAIGAPRSAPTRPSAIAAGRGP